MKIKDTAILFTISAAVMFLASCSPAKYCTEPQLNMPETFGRTITDSASLADIEWWNMYTDTLLCDLIKQTLENNKDLLSAVEKIKEMEYKYRISRADLLPALGANLSGEHEKSNYGGMSNGKDDIELKATMNIRWQIDLWGELTWSSRQGMAEFLSTVEAKRAIQMTLISEVAKAYFELVALDNELRIVSRTLTTRQEGVDQARIRFEGGLTSETSYQQAQVELATTSSLIPDLERKIALKESQIAFLTGSYPSRIRRQDSKLTTTFDKDLPLGIPSDLLERRPDVRASEQNLAAAMAAVGIAQAQRFPSLVINLYGGLENDDFRTFIQSPITYSAFSLAAPIFQFNKRKSKFKAAVSAYEQARYSYEKTVLNAFREVYDATVTYNKARENSRLKLNLQEAAKKYVDLARLQYLNGVINYLDVLDAQRKYFDAQVSLSKAVSSEYLALVDLYKALGGGWSEEDEISEIEKAENLEKAEKKAEKERKAAERKTRREKSAEKQ